MKKLVYLNSEGKEFFDTKVDRRRFVKTSLLFLPIAFGLRSAKANSVIVQRTISAATQNAIQMNNATWARPVTIPSSWNKIRFGVRMHMTNTGANLTSEPIFVMGLNSGTTNQYGDATSQNFVGMAFDTATWSWVNTSTTWYKPVAAINTIARTRVGTTNTDSNLCSDAVRWIINAGAGTSTADRAIYFIDITKGSPNFTLQMPFRTTDGAGAPGDISAANFLLFMGQTSPAPGGNYEAFDANFNTPTLAVDQVAHGTLNSVNCYWNRPDAMIEITDIAVAVLS